MTNEEANLLAYWVYRMRLLANTEKKYVAVCLASLLPVTGVTMSEKAFIRLCMNGDEKRNNEEPRLKSISRRKKKEPEKRRKSPEALKRKKEKVSDAT